MTNLYLPNFIFDCHPSLQTLTLTLDTAESAIELFTILQTNTTLKALKVKILKINGAVISPPPTGDILLLMQDLLKALSVVTVYNSIQDMLAKNRTLKCLEIDNDRYRNLSSSFLSFLTTGLRYNTSLQQLCVSIPLNKEIETFTNVISRKNNLIELKVNFKLDLSYSNCSEEGKEQIMTSLFYEQALPAVTDMLQSHTTIKLLRLKLDYVHALSSSKWIDPVQHLSKSINNHPSLEYVEFTCSWLNPFLFTTINNQEVVIERKEQRHKPLPLIYFHMTSSIP